MPPPQNARLPFPPLRPGDSIGIVAPAGAVDAERFRAGCEGLRQRGYQPVYLESVLDRDLYFAGPTKRRVRELEEMFRRDDVRAILCARGGYGCNYLLPELDYDLLRAHPKPFIGHSDVTALLTWLADMGLPAMHGPMLHIDFARDGGVNIASWESAAAGLPFTFAAGGAIALAEGMAEGVLYGGCLSILVASLGTPYECQTEGKLLLLEDINAKPYQVDRMLMQLKLAGKLEGVRGFLFGEMADCGDATMLQEVIGRVLGPLGVPVVFGLRSGHVSGDNITLPLGVPASLKAEAGAVRLAVEGTSYIEAKPIREQAGGRR